MYKVTIGYFLLGLCVALVGCSDSSDQSEDAKNPQPGEYYWITSEEGNYKVFKVLVVEEDIIHFCYYNNVFEEQPEKDIIPSLYFGSIPFSDVIFLDRVGDKTCTGRKHMAIIKKIWTNWNPNYLDIGEVTPDELEAYEEWKNGDRHVFTVKLHLPPD